MAGQPRAPFYIAVGLVVVGLVAFAAYRSDILAPAPKKIDQKINPKEAGGPNTVEAPDPGAAITTVKEYKFKPQERLPEVKGLSAYKPLEDNTVVFALNVWAGWGPIIYANDGFKAGKVWKSPDGKDFKVELRLIDDPVAMRDAYAAGDVHIGWATLDMVPLFMEGFVDASGKPRDSRAMPRIFQQVDWSNGGDGIVVRQNIKNIGDLRGKKLALAQNSPSHYFALNMLMAGGVQPSEVDMQFLTTAFEAAAAFNSQKDIAGVVSWSPDIYNLEKVKGNRMLVNTGTANRLIADVWFARADFAKDHMDICEGLVRGIFDGMVALKNETNKKKAAQLMAAGYNIPATDTLAMFNDAHSTNWTENKEFFMNPGNSTNFERVWTKSYYLYRQIGALTRPAVPFSQVMDYSIIEKLGKEQKYSSQKDEYKSTVVAKLPAELRAEKEILTNTVVIHFFPNSADLDKMVTHEVDGKQVEDKYDPNAEPVLKEVAGLVGQFGAAQILIEGHTDNSMQGQAPEALVKELSLRRAQSVKDKLVSEYHLNAKQFSVDGRGWEVPADPADPTNHTKNRRVEIKVYPAESQ